MVMGHYKKKGGGAELNIPKKNPFKILQGYAEITCHELL